MADRRFRVAFYMNNEYEVLQWDDNNDEWISHFIGSLADCEAWIRLTENENVDF